jgi:ribosomal protein L11 methyltransferase
VRDYPALDLPRADAAPSDHLDLILAALDDAGVIAVEERPAAVRLYFQSPPERERASELVRTQFGVTGLTVDVPDEDWAAKSQAALGAVTVGALTIAPPWAVPDELRTPEGAAHLVIIQPSMGFGTAHHASTRLCLAWLNQLAPVTGMVLDAGTGSGVLAIAAVRLGARRAMGIDVDPDALASARENVDLNHAAAQVELRECALTGVADLGVRFDIILANLTGGLLCREAPTFAGLLAPGGRIVVSGFQTGERNQVAGAFEDAGWSVAGERIEQEWVGLLMTRRSPAPPAPKRGQRDDRR